MLTPRDMFGAGKDNDVETLQRGLDEGIDIDAVDEVSGYTALMGTSMYKRDTDAAEFLIANGADVNATGKYEETALYEACKEGNHALAELLIQHGAMIDVNNNDGWTPCLVAAYNGQVACMKLLMEHGANINAKTNDGKTALKIAKERQFDPYVQQDNLQKRLIEKTIDVLQEYGAIEAGGGGCFIATACYGSYDAPEVAILRKYRDEKLSKTFLGRLFIRAYYRYSPHIANMLKNKPELNNLVRRYIIDRVLKLIKQ